MTNWKDQQRRLQKRIAAVKLVVDGEDYKVAASNRQKGQIPDELDDEPLTPNPFDPEISKRTWEYLMGSWRTHVRACAQKASVSVKVEEGDASDAPKPQGSKVFPRIDH